MKSWKIVVVLFGFVCLITLGFLSPKTENQMSVPQVFPLEEKLYLAKQTPANCGPYINNAGNHYILFWQTKHGEQSGMTIGLNSNMRVTFWDADPEFIIHRDGTYELKIRKSDGPCLKETGSPVSPPLQPQTPSIEDENLRRMAINECRRGHPPGGVLCHAINIHRQQSLFM